MAKRGVTKVEIVGVGSSYHPRNQRKPLWLSRNWGHGGASAELGPELWGRGLLGWFFWLCGSSGSAGRPI